MIISIQEMIGEGILIFDETNRNHQSTKLETQVLIICQKLQKTAIKEEKVEAEVKKAKVTSVKKKAEELPEIPDYERPELEVYEANDFTPSVREKSEKDKVRHQHLEIANTNTRNVPIHKTNKIFSAANS